MLDVRAHHEGCIGKRRKDGRIPVVVTRADGTREWAYIPAIPSGTRRLPLRDRRKRQDELAADKLREMLEAVGSGVALPSPKLTVADYLRGWIGERGRSRAHVRGRGAVRPATMRHLDMIVETHIVPGLGQIALRSLTRPAIQRWVNSMSGAPRSIAHRHAVLRNALEVAVGDGLLVRNPAIDVTLPDLDRKPAQTLTAEQAALLLSETTDDRLHALWALALGTSLRISELLGLAWDDWEGDSLTVRSQLYRQPGNRKLGTKGRWLLTAPKAARTQDRLALPPFAVTALTEHRRRWMGERRAEWTFYGLIFLTPRGNPYHEQQVLDDLADTCARLELPRVKLHELRHTSLSLLTDAGVPEAVRMARAGHSTVEMARHYGHVGSDPDRAAAAELERLVGGAR